MFLAPNFECFTKYDVFCSHSFDYVLKATQAYVVTKRFEITEKFHSSKALLKMAGGGDASPTSFPDNVYSESQSFLMDMPVFTVLQLYFIGRKERVL